MPKTLVEYVNPTDRQKEFIRAWQTHRFVLFGGAAGPGKSYMLRWSLILFLYQLFVTRKIERACVALFCEDYPSLHDRQISKIEREFPPWLGRLRRGDTKEFILSPEYGSGVIMLRNLDDPSKYLSTEFAGVGVDELTRDDLQTFNDLRLRLRWPGVERPLFLGATNPGGIGHAWVKKYWLDGEFPEELKELAEEFAFVKALPTDNPHLTPQYWRDLATLPEHMRKAYLEGDWNVLAGQYFSIFTKPRHVIEPPQLERWWPKWISGDWGYKHPSCFHWHAKNDDGEILTYREKWGPEIGEKNIGRILTEMSEGEKIECIYFSPDAWAQRTSANTIAEQVEDGLGNKMPTLTKADDDRVGGARLMYHLLQSDMWKISQDCPKLIECLPNLIHDEDELEDVLKVDWTPGQVGDDPYDSARYGLKSHLAPRGKPLNIRVKEKVEAYAQSRGTTTEEMEPTARAMLTRRAITMEKKKGRKGFRKPIWRPRHIQ